MVYLILKYFQFHVYTLCSWHEVDSSIFTETPSVTILLDYLKKEHFTLQSKSASHFSLTRVSFLAGIYISISRSI